MKERGIVVRNKAGVLVLVSMKANLVPISRILNVTDMHHEYHTMPENTGAIVEVDDIGDEVGLTEVFGICACRFKHCDSAWQAAHDLASHLPKRFYDLVMSAKADD